MFYEFRASGVWTDEPGTNMLDTGTHFYDVYETSDGKYVSIGSIEPKFYAELMRLSGLEKEDLPEFDRERWPVFKQRMAEVFRTKTREEWSRIMEGTDVCFAPVLSLAEAPAHPHNVKRKAFIDVGGVVQPAPAPRFSRTRCETPRPPALPGEHTEVALRDWGLSIEELKKLREGGAIV